jgi:streptomycin 6-kinase
VIIPDRLLANSGRTPEWTEWLNRLPKLITGLLADWSLTPDGAALSGAAAYVLPVRTAAGEQTMLKISWPHPEAEHEHLALRAWNGDGTVRLLRADPHRWAMLLERLEAGRDLTAVAVIEACEVVAGCYRRLHVPAIPQLVRLSEAAAEWAERLAALHDHPAVPRRLVDHAAALARDFAADPDTDGRLLHTDLHFFNVLAAEREPWLVIDPKPMSGDPHYEIAPLLWNRWQEALATRNLRSAILDRIFTVVDAAGLDEDRARDWVLVRSLVNVLWSVVDDHDSPDSGWVTTQIVLAKAAAR